MTVNEAVMHPWLSFRGAMMALKICHSLKGLNNNSATALNWISRDFFPAPLLLSRERIHKMANGTVKWFNATKGFGFIEPEEGGKDVFVHISAVQNSGLTGLDEGQKVSYEMEEDSRGRSSAAQLKVAE